LMNRLLPEPAPVNGQVNEFVLGAQVHGQSTTSTKLSVALIPSPNQWRFDLIAAGNVNSTTETTHGPATFVNQGAATYRVQKLVVIDREGIRVTPASGQADSSGELAGLCTSYDGVPILRQVVRNYAMSQHAQKKACADRETEEKITAKAQQEVD